MIQERIRWPERLGRTLLEIFFPGQCVGCGDRLLFRSDLRFPICTSCQEALSPIQEKERCSVCSVPLISELQFCTRCSQRSFSFASNFSVYEYRGLARHIISQFKFSNRRSVALFVAHLLYPELEKRYNGLPLVPVPGSRRSVRRRGWDPMLEVSKALRRVAGTQILPVLRRGSGGPQKGLHFQDRLDNIRGTISLRGIPDRPPEKVVLIDDIFTSGATAEECARVLRQGGIAGVQVFTMAVEL